MFTCAIDQKQFATLKELHSYLGRSLRVKIEDYYPQYFPRRDLLTGELIPFDDYDHYFSSSFVNRANMVKFFKTCPKEDVAPTARLLFDARRALKNWKFVPSTVETRISVLPSPLLLASREVSMNEVMDGSLLPHRFSYEKAIIENVPPQKIFIDTREQKPLPLNGLDTEFVKLDFGDYICAEPFSDVFFERKSLVDLCGTLSKGYERFKQEMARSALAGAYLIVIVEAPISMLDEIGRSMDTSSVKATPSFIKARIRDALQSFGNLQFIFTKNRTHLADVMQKIMGMGRQIVSQDAQYLLDIGQI